MIRTEYYKTRSDGVVLNRTYSDRGMMMLQNETGIEYGEAIDVEGALYTYTETDKPIPVDDVPETGVLDVLEVAYQKGVNEV